MSVTKPKLVSLQALRRFVRAALAAVFLAAMLCLPLAQARCQSDNNSEAWGGIDITLDARGTAHIDASLPEAPSDLVAYERCISQVVGGVLKHIHTGMGQDGWTLTADSSNVDRRRELLVSARIDFDPILKMLRASGYNRLYITIQHPRGAYAAPARGMRHDADWNDTVFYELNIPMPVSGPVPAIDLAYGYRSRDLLTLGLPLAMVLLAPVVLTLWMRRRALSAADSDPTAIWFSYMRWSSLGMNAMMLVWTGLAIALRADRFWMFLFNVSSPEGSAALFMLQLGVPPMLVQTLCSSLSYPVYVGVRGSGWTRRELIAQTFWRQSGLVMPATLLMAGMGAFRTSHAQQGVLLLAAALAARLFTVDRLNRVLRITPSAVTVGELRDRLFALAEQAHVNVTQIYYLSAGKGRTANAYARVGNAILVTDYLLEHLSKREVDAIMAHELGHLKHRHPARLTRTLVLIYAAIALLVFASVRSTPAHANLWFALFPALLVPATYFYTSLTRGFERMADREAVRLTGDPEALITGLVKVTRLSLLPLEWGAGRLMSHPSTLRRARAISAEAGISETQTQDLLSDAQSVGDHYGLPSVPSDTPPLFSTSFKQQAQFRNAWILMGLATMIPAAFARGVADLRLADGVAWGWLLLGATITALVAIEAYHRISVGGLARIAPKLAARLNLMYDRSQVDRPCYVLFAPDPNCRLYEGYYNWDIGFLLLDADHLRYLGERTHFILRYNQILSVSIRADQPGWRRTEVLVIHWHDTECNRSGAFSVTVGDITSVRVHTTRMRRLKQQIVSWCNEPRTPADIGDRDRISDLPDAGSVTSRSPVELTRIPMLLPSLIIQAFVGAGVAVAFGLSITPGLQGSGWYVICVSLVIALLMWIPVRLYQEAKTT